MITHTRTHTRYFDADMVRSLYVLAKSMSDEWDTRSQFIDQETRDLGEARLAALFAVILLCDESAP